MKPWKRKVGQKEKWKTLKKERMKPNNRKNKGTAKGCKGEEVEKKDKGDNEKCEK